MAYENDYILRLIHEVIKTLFKLIFGTDINSSEGELSNLSESASEKFKKLTALLEKGEINDAENILIENMDASDLDDFRIALLFYESLNKKDNSFLESHGYTRREISEGVIYVADLYGYGSIIEAFIKEIEDID